MRRLLLTSLMAISLPAIAGTDILGTLAPLGDGIEFVLTAQTGCRTRHSEKPLLHGAVFGSGRNDIPYVAGCWERLPNNDVRVYIDQWYPDYQITTVPAASLTEEVIDADRSPPVRLTGRRAS